MIKTSNRIRSMEKFEWHRIEQCNICESRNKPSQMSTWRVIRAKVKKRLGVQYSRRRDTKRINISAQWTTGWRTSSLGWDKSPPRRCGARHAKGALPCAPICPFIVLNGGFSPRRIYCSLPAFFVFNENCPWTRRSMRLLVSFSALFIIK